MRSCNGHRGDQRNQIAVHKWAQEKLVGVTELGQVKEEGAWAGQDKEQRACGGNARSMGPGRRRGTHKQDSSVLLHEAPAVDGLHEV